MSNAKPLDTRERLYRTSGGRAMTLRQARQFLRQAKRQSYRLTDPDAWTDPPAPKPHPRESAKAPRHHSVASYCDPATCPAKHRRPRLHATSRADLAKLLREAALTVVEILGSEHHER